MKSKMMIVQRSLRVLMTMLLFSSLSIYSHAEEGLNEQQIQRVHECNHLLEEVNSASVQRTIRELEQSDDPEMNLQILEAKAMTYTEIVRDKNVEELKNKKWLYGLVAMNMALLQFGGSGGGKGRDADLNRLIQKKLREHLPADIFERPGFIQSIEDFNNLDSN